ncbi:MAG: TIR domain-containing protein [Eubacteriales bacterium]
MKECQQCGKILENDATFCDECGSLLNSIKKESVHLKCKMCGGDIVADAKQSYGTCGSCGSTSTIPKVNDEQIANLFNRANHFRMQNDFDKALLAYENILNSDNTNAEAHWGVVLSKYGIEYIDDPVTSSKTPTYHRVQMQSILQDRDYLAALEYAGDGYTANLYEQEATKLYEIQKRILEISRQEAPYDVFICYKETSQTGTRTVDRTLAQDIYYQLKQEGYKVFFAKITLEDKLGTEYEPYIFSALNSAKIMLVIGTTTEYFNATWVKNEWIRYLELMKNDTNRLLIPCYRDMDAYDMPMELTTFQSQDMSKIGFMQDLIRGINKVLAPTVTKGVVPQTVTTQVVHAPTNNGTDMQVLLKRADIFLGDGDFSSAGTYYNKVLDLDPECAMAYWGKYKVEIGATSDEGIVDGLKRTLYNIIYQGQAGDDIKEQFIKTYLPEESRVQSNTLVEEKILHRKLLKSVEHLLAESVPLQASQMENITEVFRKYTPRLEYNGNKAFHFGTQEEVEVWNRYVGQLDEGLEEFQQAALQQFNQVNEQNLSSIEEQVSTIAQLWERGQKAITAKRIWLRCAIAKFMIDFVIGFLAVTNPEFFVDLNAVLTIYIYVLPVVITFFFIRWGIFAKTGIYKCLLWLAGIVGLLAFFEKDTTGFLLYFGIEILCGLYVSNICPIIVGVQWIIRATKRMKTVK